MSRLKTIKLAETMAAFMVIWASVLLVGGITVAVLIALRVIKVA